MKYLVLIGDIIESKKIQKRELFQSEFQDLVNSLNSEHKEKFVSPLTITLGDEFQGLMNDSKNLFLLIHKIQSSFQNVTFRFALSVGDISTKLNHKNAIGMDGAGFHFARDAMEKNKIEKRNFAYDGAQPEAIIIDNMLKWIDLSTAKWKKEKWKTLLLKQQGKSQKEIEHQIRISQSAISQNLKNQTTLLVIETEKIIEHYLKNLLK
jgi:hypothetical protein